MERLPVEPDRLFVAENGTDHLTGDEAGWMPAELQRRGFLAGEFAAVLGVNYSHKNRDLAVRAFTELRERGIAMSLVCVGALAPQGTSRVHEARAASRYDSDVFVIPDVSSEERNWLLRHASVVLYPTSAEGFGLVPYEAARFGTPTVLVPFGPLRETAGSLPVGAANWTPQALADAAEALVRDPALAQQQVSAALEAGTSYTWDRTAANLVRVYRSILARPSR
jgi:glycosyltransferase involved in cell wall biosynthesis